MSDPSDKTLEAAMAAPPATPEHPRYQEIAQIAASLEETVRFLRDEFPNGEIRGLASRVWDILGSGEIPLVAGPQFEGIGLLGVTDGPSALQGLRLTMPWNWVDLMRREPTLHMGGVCNVGAQIVDIYDGRFHEDETILRGIAWEADFILEIQRLGHPLHPYQEWVLGEFPQGRRSPQAVLLFGQPGVTPPKETVWS